MKKLIPMLVLLAFSFAAKASITFTLIHSVCDSNGVLVANISTASLPPYTIYYSSCSHSVSHTLTGTVLTDTLYHYNGAPLSVTLYDSTSGFIDSGSYAGALPFAINYATTTAVCPAWATITAIPSTTSGPLPTGPLTYHWYNSVTMAPLSTTTATISVPSGTYGLWVSDTAGCGTGSPVTCGYVDAVVTSPFNVDTLLTTTASCTNGTAKIVGYTGTYTLPMYYLWSNGATTDSVSGLSQGSISVTVTDAIGCTASQSTWISQSPYITATATPTPATCLTNDGSCIAFGAGGMPPYTYSWSNGATTQNVTGLTSGYINVTVTDANGCSGTSGAYISASTPISVTYATTPSSCVSPTGTASLTFAGGTMPYRDTFYCSPIQTGPVASGLASGTYAFHVVDAVGCVQDGSVYVPPIDVLSASFSQVPALCTLATGSLTMSVTGGVAPLTYAWSTGSVSDHISSVAAGTYSVTVTDANGCSISKWPYLDNTSPLSIGFSTTPASCIFTADGAISAAVFGGTAPYTFSWPFSGSTSTITGLPGDRWYNVFVTDANGCTAIDWDYVGYNAMDSSCLCVIKGTVYHDINTNCTRDAGEPGIPDIQIYCSGVGYTYTDDSGNYTFIVPAGTYTVSETVETFYPLTSCQYNYIPVTTSAGAGCMHEIDFANLYDTLHEMQISTWDYLGYPVPGNSYTQVCVIHNAGSVTESNILAGYKSDGQLFGSSFVPATVFSALGSSYDYNSGTGTFPTLAPGGSQIFFINYSVPTFIPLGTNVVFKDSVVATAPMSSWVADYAPWNNVNYFTSVVVGSFDPNFKEVNPKGQGALGIVPLTDTIFQYMVHFQNTGTAPAQNIVVLDTLDANLDWSSLRPVYASAPCRITQTTGGVVKFTFKNINLPTNTSNLMGSNGMFIYSIKRKPTLTIGDQFRNSASIYFDYNAPIKTNYTVNTIGWNLEVPKTIAASDFFEVYPNPAQNQFTATITAERNVTDAQLAITDITGKVISTRALTLTQGTQTVSVDASRLAAGMYLVTVSQDGKTGTKKLVIVK
jgi:uncharacterized repeat protein (TIGR01451 family)